jgi:hypothetical protein
MNTLIKTACLTCVLVLLSITSTANAQQSTIVHEQVGVWTAHADASSRYVNDIVFPVELKVEGDLNFGVTDSSSINTILVLQDSNGNNVSDAAAENSSLVLTSLPAGNYQLVVQSSLVSSGSTNIAEPFFMLTASSATLSQDDLVLSKGSFEEFNITLGDTWSSAADESAKDYVVYSKTPGNSYALWLESQIASTIIVENANLEDNPAPVDYLPNTFKKVTGDASFGPGRDQKLFFSADGINLQQDSDFELHMVNIFSKSSGCSSCNVESEYIEFYPRPQYYQDIAGSWQVTSGQSYTSAGNPRYKVVLTEAAALQISLESETDSYLYLLDEKRKMMMTALVWMPG